MELAGLSVAEAVYDAIPPLVLAGSSKRRIMVSDRLLVLRCL